LIALSWWLATKSGRGRPKLCGEALGSAINRTAIDEQRHRKWLRRRRRDEEGFPTANQLALEEAVKLPDFTPPDLSRHM